jgi:endonuclease-3
MPTTYSPSRRRDATQTLQAEAVVARKTPGPRQPLSQARPKAGRGIAKAKVAAGRLKGPPTSKVGRSVKKSVIPAPQHPSKKRANPRRRIPPDALEAHAQTIFARLSALYPDAHCELDFTDAWQLVQATILSAQCTDKRVNMVTPTLFTTYPTPTALAGARQEEVEEIIRTTGFFRNKARNLIAMAGAVVERHEGQVPPSMDALVKLPGVGRKTANVVLGNAWHINEGVVVDTHVQRLSGRLGLTSETDPERIERVLMTLYDREQWTLLSHLLIWHGRRICEARKPRCVDCALNDICPSAFRV